MLMFLDAAMCEAIIPITDRSTLRFLLGLWECVGQQASSMRTGIHGVYEWLEADHDLSEFLSLCTSAISARYIVITAVDSGSFNPSEQDRAIGWTAAGGIA